jgi:hypothetical protein
MLIKELQLGIHGSGRTTTCNTSCFTYWTELMLGSEKIPSVMVTNKHTDPLQIVQRITLASLAKKDPWWFMKLIGELYDSIITKDITLTLETDDKEPVKLLKEVVARLNLPL